MNDWHIKTIVLGYDGSEGADQAARLAAALARKHGARVVVVTAFTGVSAGQLGEKDIRKIESADDTCRRMVRELIEMGVEAEPDVLEGSASEVLLNVAEAQGANLIIVGRRGHGLLADLLLGSTSEYVVRRATVPVLVADHRPS